MADMSARLNHGRQVSSAEPSARMSATASYALRRLMIYLCNRNHGANTGYPVVDCGGAKSTTIIEILMNARLHDSTQAPKLSCLLEVPRVIANIVDPDRSEAKNRMTKTEAAIELVHKLG